MEGVGPMGRRGGGRGYIICLFFVCGAPVRGRGTHVLGIFSRQVGQLD